MAFFIEEAARMRSTFFVRRPDGWYFRVLGYGLSWDASGYVSFGERNGYVKPLQIRLFGGRLRWLKRERRAIKPSCNACRFGKNDAGGYIACRRHAPAVIQTPSSYS